MVDGGGGSTNNRSRAGRSTLLENRPDNPEGRRKGTTGKGTSGGSGNNNLRTFIEDIDIDEFNKLPPEIRKGIEAKQNRKINRAYASYRQEDLENLLEQEKSKRLRSNPLSKPSSTEKELAQADEFLKFQDAELSKSVISLDPFSDTFTNQQIKELADNFKALSGTNPVTQPKFSSSQIVPFDRGLQMGDLYSMLEPKAFEARSDAFADMFDVQQSGLSKIKTVDDALKINQPPDLDKIINSGRLDNLKRTLNSPKVRAGGFAALDVGFTALDFAQRKGSGQTNLQAGVGAGGGLVGGMVAQGITGAALAKLAAGTALAPVPGARPLALLLLLGAGMMGGMAGGDIADSLTGVNAGQEPKVKRDKRGRIIKSKPTPTQAPIEVEELPINSSEELEDEMIKEAFLSGALLNSGGAGMIQYVPVPFEVPVTVKVPVIPSSHWGYTLNGG